MSEIIWVQFVDDDGNELDEPTFNECQIYDADERYVRADTVAALEDRIAELECSVLDQKALYEHEATYNGMRMIHIAELEEELAGRDKRIAELDQENANLQLQLGELQEQHLELQISYDELGIRLSDEL